MSHKRAVKWKLESYNYSDIQPFYDKVWAFWTQTCGKNAVTN